MPCLSCHSPSSLMSLARHVSQYRLLRPASRHANLEANAGHRGSIPSTPNDKLRSNCGSYWIFGHEWFSRSMAHRLTGVAEVELLQVKLLGMTKRAGVRCANRSSRSCSPSQHVADDYCESHDRRSYLSESSMWSMVLYHAGLGHDEEKNDLRAAESVLCGSVVK